MRSNLFCAVKVEKMCMISDGHYHTPCQHYTCKRTTEACAGAEGLIKPSITSFKGTCAPPAEPVEKEASGRGVVWIERRRSSGVVKPWVNTDVGSRVASVTSSQEHRLATRTVQKRPAHLHAYVHTMYRCTCGIGRLTARIRNLLLHHCYLIHFSHYD